MMKKIIVKLIFAVTIFLPIKVMAAGNISISPSSLTIEEGSTKTITVSAYNTIGDVSISSSNPIVATTNVSSWGTGMVEEKTTKKGIITITGKSVGSSTLIFSLDAATFDGEDLSGQKRTVQVTVIAKNVKPPVVDNRSKNNNLKEISVSGYDLQKVGNDEYALSVASHVSSIHVVAVAEDNKAKVTGAGEHSLNVGENTIEVIVTSEAGTKRKVNIKVVRKDGYTKEDLDVLLASDENEINITIDQDTKLTKEELSKIKTSNKKIHLHYFNQDKKLIYQWTLDSKNIDNPEEFVTTILYDSSYKERIAELSNYADCMYISYPGNGFPKNINVRLYVGDKFINGDLVNLYSYTKESDQLDLVKNDLKVEDGYIEYDSALLADSIITKSKVSHPTECKVSKDSSKHNVILTIVVLILLLAVVSEYLLFRKKSIRK